MKQQVNVSIELQCEVVGDTVLLIDIFCVILHCRWWFTISSYLINVMTRWSHHLSTSVQTHCSLSLARAVDFIPFCWRRAKYSTAPTMTSCDSYRPRYSVVSHSNPRTRMANYGAVYIDHSAIAQWLKLAIADCHAPQRLPSGIFHLQIWHF